MKGYWKYVPTVVMLLLVGGFVGYWIGSNYQREDREDLLFSAGMYKEADTVRQEVERQLKQAKRDEERARSSYDQALAQSRIDALNPIADVLDQDRSRLYQHLWWLRDRLGYAQPH
jgi:hypothetical protein